MKSETIQFLIELRKRIIRCLFILALIVIITSFFANDIYQFLALPILKHLTAQQGLIATAVPAPFLIPFKSALVASIFLAMPFFLNQLWSFISPALYRNERRLAWVLLFISTLLFYCGIIFAYLLVLPIVFKFFIYIAPAGVEVKPDISQYFSFVMKMFFAFGLSFELPIAIVLIVWTGICSIETLAKKRPYVIVGAFIVGMLLTPPDIISQILLAVPLWLLFELGLRLSRFVKFHSHLKNTVGNK